jgi:hypothetical protein
MKSQSTSSESRDYIPRRLSWTDKNLKRQSVQEKQLFERFTGPVVILGDPGMGKTWLMEMYGKHPGCRFIRATSLLRRPDSTDYGTDRLIIDGLDEVSALGEEDPLNEVLTKLLACGAPSFAISCRAAEWRGKSAEIDISDDYGQAPAVVDLELLTSDEAIEALSRRVDEQRAYAAVRALQSAGLESFFQNPLYLDFVAAIVSADDEVPQTRAGLYEKAIDQLCIERNPYHESRGFSLLSRDEALNAAGALCAAILITGHSTILREGKSTEAIPVAELGELATTEHLRAVLGSNLFRAAQGAKGEFRPLHRTVAEFLAARWLARYLDDKIDAKNEPRFIAHRLMSMICGDGGVPASLRGLHAWLPKFSPTRLGPDAIDRDPYGILRYGDGDGLAPDQARTLIAALRQQANFDPHFRDGWGRSEALSGLGQPALADDLCQIINDKAESVMFRLVILEAIVGSPVAPLLNEELSNILFDKDRAYRERRDAGEALAASDRIDFDWPDALRRLIALADPDSTRVGAELLDDIGYEALEPKLVAQVILADCRLTESEKGSRQRTFGSFYRLKREYPHDRISELLDSFAEILIPQLDPKKWWGDGLHDGWSEFGDLVQSLAAQQLTDNPNSVSPEQLWNWLRMVERRYRQRDPDRETIASILVANDRLRRGIQRLALFEDRDEDRYFAANVRIGRMSIGLHLKPEDAELLLTEVVQRRDPADRQRWMGLVASFRTEGIIPVPIRKIARPYAKGDPELMEFLVQKPKRQKMDDWDRKFRRRERDRARREEKNREKQRSDYSANIEGLRSGDLGWIIRPAKAYLNMYSDLDRDASPEERLEEWLGSSLCKAALEGFEAALHRDDLPSADQIAQGYAESRVWNFVFPMLAGAGQRLQNGTGFSDLPPEMLSALLIASDHELITSGETFEGLDEALRELLRQNEVEYEAHLRRMFEPMLEAKREHIHDLYRFAHHPAERPLSCRLSVEWLERFADLPLGVEKYLVEGVLHSPAVIQNELMPRLVEIARHRVDAIEPGGDRRAYWLGVHFCIDFDRAMRSLPEFTKDNRGWLWSLTHLLNDRSQNHEHYVKPSLSQLDWLFRTFRKLWPYTARPDGTTSGDQNPWDATQLLEWTIYQIGKNPSAEASEILRNLRDEHEDGYTTIIQANIAGQRRAQVEANFQSPSLAEFKAVLASSAQPQSAGDVQAIILAELETLQKRLRGDPLNPVDNFFRDGGTPKTENECRDQMLLLLGNNLPFGIQAPAEVSMPRRKRSDGAFTFGKLLVPLECKGQWHKELWTAASSQLDRYYAVHHQAAQKGIYVVFWFGADVPAGRKLKAPSKHVPKPVTANDMKLALQAAMPGNKRSETAIVVLDLTRP